MFVYNRQHPMGGETGVTPGLDDRRPLATREQNRALAAYHLEVARRERPLIQSLNRRGAQSDDRLMANASVLPRDVWGEWDREGIEVARNVLAVFGDLASSVGTSIPIGKIVKHFQRISDSGSLNVSLDGRSKARRDQPTRDYVGTPVPIFDSTFAFGWREMMAAMSEGEDITGAARRNAMREVLEGLELMAINGRADIEYNGIPIYGMSNHPERETRSTTNDLSSCTGAEWLADVNATLALLHANNFRTPATLYVNWDDWFYATQTDYSTQYPNKTIAQRVLENGGVREVIPASNVAADTIFAIIKDRDVVEVLNGMPPNTRQQFRANPEDEYEFVHMAIQSIQFKYDMENQMGLAHSS